MFSVSSQSMVNRNGHTTIAPRKTELRNFFKLNKFWFYSLFYLKYSTTFNNFGGGLWISHMMIQVVIVFTESTFFISPFNLWKGIREIEKEKKRKFQFVRPMNSEFLDGILVVVAYELWQYVIVLCCVHVNR